MYELQVTQVNCFYLIVIENYGEGNMFKYFCKCTYFQTQGLKYVQYQGAENLVR